MPGATKSWRSGSEDSCIILRTKHMNAGLENQCCTSIEIRIQAIRSRCKCRYILTQLSLLVYPPHLVILQDLRLSTIHITSEATSQVNRTTRSARDSLMLNQVDQYPNAVKISSSMDLTFASPRIDKRRSGSDTIVGLWDGESPICKFHQNCISIGVPQVHLTDILEPTLVGTDPVLQRAFDLLNILCVLRCTSLACSSCDHMRSPYFRSSKHWEATVCLNTDFTEKTLKWLKHCTPQKASQFSPKNFLQYCPGL